MKRWLPRTLWLLAWSFWAWLGWGLYRELPRDLGPMVRHIPLGYSENQLGLLPHEDILVTEFEDDERESKRINCWDLSSGQLATSCKGPIRGFEHEESVVLRHAIIVGVNADTLQPPKQPQILDLRTGKWREAPYFSWRLLCAHPRRPLLVAELEDTNRILVSIEVFDFTSAKALYRWTPPLISSAGEIEVARCDFIPESDFLMIAYRVRPKQSKLAERLVIELHDTQAGRKVSEIQSPSLYLSVSAPSLNGRIVMCEIAERHGALTILDLWSGQFVLSNMRDAGEGFCDHDDLKLALARGLELSPDGRTLILGDSLFDIDSRKRIWECRAKIDEIEGRKVGPNGIAVAETWEHVFGDWLMPLSSVQTRALRDFNTGKVRVRTWLADSVDDASRNQRYFVDDDGSVYETSLLSISLSLPSAKPSSLCRSSFFGRSCGGAVNANSDL